MERDEFYLNLYLAHHGITGQKWGKKNGPPYPLSPEEHADVIKKGDVKTLKENMSEFKDWEIEATLKRFNFNQTLTNLTKEAPVKTPKQLKDEAFISKWNNVAKKAGAFGDAAAKTANAAESSIRVYNAVAKTMNGLFGKNMKIIEMPGKKDKNGKNNNNNNNNKKSVKSFADLIRSERESDKKYRDQQNRLNQEFKNDLKRQKNSEKLALRRNRFNEKQSLRKEEYINELKEKYDNKWYDYYNKNLYS